MCALTGQSLKCFWCGMVCEVMHAYMLAPKSRVRAVVSGEGTWDGGRAGSERLTFNYTAFYMV